jgi:hypothetical protein
MIATSRAAIQVNVEPKMPGLLIDRFLRFGEQINQKRGESALLDGQRGPDVPPVRWAVPFAQRPGHQSAAW